MLLEDPPIDDEVWELCIVVLARSPTKCCLFLERLRLERAEGMLQTLHRCRHILSQALGLTDHSSRAFRCLLPGPALLALWHRCDSGIRWPRNLSGLSEITSVKCLQSRRVTPSACSHTMSHAFFVGPKELSSLCQRWMSKHVRICFGGLMAAKRKATPLDTLPPICGGAVVTSVVPWSSGAATIASLT